MFLPQIFLPEGLTGATPGAVRRNELAARLAANSTYLRAIGRQVANLGAR